MNKCLLARTGLLLAVTAVSVACSQLDRASQGARPAGATAEITNATNFHLLDFVAWNNRDVGLFRHLHTADVKVDFAGNKTEGIDAHVQALQPMWRPTALITNHSPIIAEGEWTCMVGTMAPPTGAKMVTAAKWRDGAIAEEYILANLLKPGTQPPPVSGPLVMSISNRSGALNKYGGAGPEWTCSLGRTSEGKMVIAVRKTGGTGADDMVFAQ